MVQLHGSRALPGRAETSPFAREIMVSQATYLLADPGLSSGWPPAGRRRRCLRSPPSVPLPTGPDQPSRGRRPLLDTARPGCRVGQEAARSPGSARRHRGMPRSAACPGRCSRRRETQPYVFEQSVKSDQSLALVHYHRNKVALGVYVPVT